MDDYKKELLRRRELAKNPGTAEDRMEQIIKEGYGPDLKKTSVRSAFLKVRERVLPGDKVYTIITSYSTRSLTRAYILLVPTKEPQGLEIWDLTYYIKELLGYKVHKRGGNSIRGGDAEDMIQELSYLLYGNAFLLHMVRVNY